MEAGFFKSNHINMQWLPSYVCSCISIQMLQDLRTTFKWIKVSITQGKLANKFSRLILLLSVSVLSYDGMALVNGITFNGNKINYKAYCEWLPKRTKVTLCILAIHFIVCKRLFTTCTLVTRQSTLVTKVSGCTHNKAFVED